MKTITMTELKNYLAPLKSTELVLDVRTAEEFREGHVPGSKNIPHDQISPSHLENLKKYDCVYVYCRAGGRAGMAADELKKAGIKHIVQVANSGMPEWNSAGFPVET